VPKKPVPLWIKILLPLSAALLISCIFILPSVLKAGLDCERGWKAQQEGRHSTAIKEYRRALEQFPDSTSIIARLAISYLYNERIDKCSEMLDRIAGRRLHGKLANQINSIVEKMDSTYHESKELVEVLMLYGQEEMENTALKLEKYLEKNENDVMGIFHLANINFDIGRYGVAEELYIRAIKLEPEFYSANLNLAAVYRETGRYEKAMECCNKVLSNNKEHPQAFIALSKLELAKGDYKTALGYAENAYEYDNSDLQVVSNLSIAYHYNKMFAERDGLFETLKQKDYYDIAAMQVVFNENPSMK
jgi:tetratricopeptide (TPR) repeat protein